MTPALLNASSGAPSGAILELGGIKVTFAGSPEKIEEKIEKEVGENKSFYKCISVTCKSWLCPDCRRVKGHDLRERLLEKAPLFKMPRLYTITVNREWFKGPAEAYEYVMKEKFIARLLTKELKIRRWIWVLEAQEENGDGWPHWHILLDVADLPGMWYNSATKESSPVKPPDTVGWCYIPHFFDLNRVHRLLRKWKVGEQCYLSVKKERFQNQKHAIFYITKYLLKTPKRGFPPWMWHHRNLRFYQPSQEVGSMGNTAENKDKPRVKHLNQKRKVRFPLDRVSECSLKVLYKGYDEKRDQFVTVLPKWGMKKVLLLYPKAAIVQDFDFETKKSFHSCGFWSLNDMAQYHYFWNEKEGKACLLGIMEERKETFLNAWRNSA